jgi:parallel beta-helix repeat protein
MKKKTICLAVVFLVFLVVLPWISAIQSHPSLIAANLNGPITQNLDPYEIDINSKTDFDTYSDSGTGTPGDPYIIENRTIDLTGQLKGGISIFGTGYHFIIRNCYLIGDDDYAGILIWEAENGTLTNNTITNFQYGIQIKGASYVNITHNILTANYWRGLEIAYVLASSQFIDVINNTITNQDLQSGCRVDWAYHCTFINNTCNHNAAKGLWLANADDNLVLNNTANNNGDYGFLVEDANFNNFTLNTAIGNPLNGFRADDCHNLTFHLNTAIDNEESGYEWLNVSYSSFTNNSAILNGFHGLLLTYYSAHNTITENTFEQNARECIFESSTCSDNQIENNNCDSVDGGGIPGFQWIFSVFGITFALFATVGTFKQRKHSTPF